MTPISRGIVVCALRPGQVFDIEDTAMAIPDHAWDGPGGVHAGRGNFAIHSAPNDLNAITGVERSRVDAALFYFMDVSVARAFVERFACGLAVVTSTRLADG